MNEYKNAQKNAIVRTIVMVMAIIIGVVALFLSYSAFKESSKLPLLRAVGVCFLSITLIVGVAYGVFTVLFKKRVFALISAIGIWLGVSILLAVCGIIWWAVLIISVALLTILVLCLMGVYNKQLVVVPDNASPDYKDYKTRQAEKKEAEKNKPEEKLPEIKSFD